MLEWSTIAQDEQAFAKSFPCLGDVLFTSPIPLATLIAWVRALKYGTEAGISPARIFRQQAKSGSVRSRTLAAAIAERLAEGESLEDALAPASDRFPPLVLELIAVGEKTGRLGETFEELEKYLEALQESQTRFYRALIWPSFMYFAAIAVVAFMLLILGLIAPAGGQPFDPLGLGLLGPSGAATFLVIAGLTTVIILLAAIALKNQRSFRARAAGLALPLPIVGDFLRDLALHRFSLAMMMASEAGMRADKTLELAFRAASNDAFSRYVTHAVKRAESGRDMTSILAGCDPRLFPVDFRHAVEVGELTGQLPEVLAKQSQRLRDQALGKLALLTSIASSAVYAFIAGMIILVIIRIFLSIANIYQDALRGL